VYKRQALTLLVISAVIFTSCKGALVDPPEAWFKITKGPNDGDVLNVDYANFEWEGNDTKFQYRYKLMVIDEVTQQPVDYLSYGVWNEDTEQLFKNLDEGSYIFQVQASYDGTDPITVQRKFSIDAIQGPSIMFYKTETKAVLGEFAEVNIWMEDVDSLTILSVGISFDNSVVNLDSASVGDYVTGANMKQFLAPDVSAIKKDINQTGSVKLYTTFLPESGTAAKSISGTGKIIKLVFYVAGVGKSNLEFYSIEAKDYHGKIIPVTTRNGVINGISD
jgi:hypothetical protein